MGNELLPPGAGGGNGGGNGRGNGGDGIEPVDLKAALEERYLAYALSTIMHRALPDVRDGLKPVHRRILHAMRLARLEPGTRFSKSAAIVGDVMGKFHPHGDQSIYDALVRLAQPFAMRYPLVDGQGNFGNIDGDNAAAMRYTEARMTEAASELLDGITEDAVDFRPTYNEENEEPVVLPGAFPNLLANGASGIAVGMATSIPPHNVAELCEAALHLIAQPDAATADLLHYVQGPDFPTGGIVVDSREAIREAYESGRGAFRVRSKWAIEDQGRGTWIAVVTEIPYGVQKSRLIEKSAELLQARRLPLIDDVRDESAEDIRVVIAPKSRTVDPALMMESLFKLTEFETRFPLNMNVLSRGRVPGVLSLKAVLAEWLEHRREVLVRRSAHRLGEIDAAARDPRRLPRRLSEHRRGDKDHPRRGRAQAGDDGALGAHRPAGRIDPQHAPAGAAQAGGVRNPQGVRHPSPRRSGRSRRCWPRRRSSGRPIRWQVEQIRKKYGPDTELGRRRTAFAEAPEVDLAEVQQAMIEKEPVTIILSEKGWLRAMRGHLADTSALAFKEGDGPKLSFHAQTTDKILLFTTGGKFFTLGADRLPGGRGQGEPIRIMVDMENDQSVVTAFVHDPARKLLLVSFAGNGFVVPEAEVVANTRKGKQVMNVKSPDEAKLCLPMPAEADHLAVLGDNRKLLIFKFAGEGALDTDHIPEMPRGKGVRLQKYKDGGVSDAKPFAGADGLSWTDSAGRVFVKPLAELGEWVGSRAGAGRVVPKGFPRTGRF